MTAVCDNGVSNSSSSSVSKEVDDSIKSGSLNGEEDLINTGLLPSNETSPPPIPAAGINTGGDSSCWITSRPSVPPLISATAAGSNTGGDSTNSGIPFLGEYGSCWLTSWTSTSVRLTKLGGVSRRRRGGSVAISYKIDLTEVTLSRLLLISSSVFLTRVGGTSFNSKGGFWTS